jgi:hypothetical protein
MKELKYKKFSWDTHEKNWKLKSLMFVNSN